MTTKSKFTQVVVWPGTVVGAKKIKEFETFMKENFDARVKYIEEIKTLPDMKNKKPVAKTGGRNDVFFYIHTDDINKFAISRLQYGMRWIEDVLANEKSFSVYPARVRKYKTW